MFTGHEPPPSTPRRPPKPPTGPRPPPGMGGAARTCGSGPHGSLTLYTGSTVRQESGCAALPQRYVQMRSGAPQALWRSGAPPTLQRTTAQSLRVVPCSPRRRPPLCSPILCPCVLTQPHALPCTSQRCTPGRSCAAALPSPPSASAPP